jgi:hypothetical protein
MILRIILFFMLVLFTTSCGGAAAPATEAPAATEEPAAPEAPTETFLGNSPSNVSTEISSPEPTPTQILPTPTDTPLPTLDLPTEAANAPVQMVWDGTPTYLGDSTPGYSFRVTYDPNLWALTSDQFGFPALGHRNIPSCVIAVTSGRGLPANMTVEHNVLVIENIAFDVSRVYENGVLKFVTYTGGDRTIITGFEVSFDEQMDECLADAETVLSTLRSVPVSQATPQP